MFNVSFQPGCKYLIQLRAEGNDHIERALPQHRSIEVGRKLKTAFQRIHLAESFRQQKSFHFWKSTSQFHFSSPS